MVRRYLEFASREALRVHHLDLIRVGFDVANWFEISVVVDAKHVCAHFVRVLAAVALADWTLIERNVQVVLRNVTQD